MDFEILFVMIPMGILVGLYISKYLLNKNKSTTIKKSQKSLNILLMNLTEIGDNILRMSDNYNDALFRRDFKNEQKIHLTIKDLYLIKKDALRNVSNADLLYFKSILKQNLSDEDPRITNAKYDLLKIIEELD